MAILPKTLYRFNTTTPTMTFFTEIEHQYLKYIWSHKKLLNTQSKPESVKRNTGDSTSEFKLFYRTVCVCVWAYIFIDTSHIKYNI